MKLTGIRILLAAGDSSVAARLGNALEIAGFEVAIVGRALDVIRIVARSAPDVLICDTDLPDGDSLQLARRMRRQAVPFPVILLANEPFESDQISADRAIGITHFTSLIPVPCDEQRIIDLVVELVSDIRSTGSSQTGFPTRVIWPTARRRAALLAR